MHGHDQVHSPRQPLSITSHSRSIAQRLLNAVLLQPALLETLASSARVVQVLEVENHQAKAANAVLEEQLAARTGVPDLARRRPPRS
jgi:hypothetical protein